jgi:hypothetical protein
VKRRDTCGVKRIVVQMVGVMVMDAGLVIVAVEEIQRHVRIIKMVEMGMMVVHQVVMMKKDL